MDKKEILKAKVDWWKTTMAATITCIIGYWQTKDIPSARTSFFITSVGFFIIFTISTSYYVSRHKKLIKELYKK